MTLRTKILASFAAGILLIAGGSAVLGLQRLLAPPTGSQSVVLYKDWRLTCLPLRGTLSACSLSQDAVNKEGQTIVRLSMGAGRAAGKLIVIVPHDVLLTQGLGLSIGKDKVLAARFETCDGIGCMALIPIDESLQDAIAANDGGQVVYFGLDNKPVSLSYSLRGFTEGRAAFERVVDRENAWWGFLVR